MTSEEAEGVKPKKPRGFQHTPLPKYYSASRELRNQAEKQRRDKLNYHVSELASLVPFVVRAQKKVDKTSVLRLAASYLRMNQILQQNDCSAPFAMVDSKSSRSLLNSIGGFLLVVTNVGKVVYVSDAIEDTFGYSQADVLGQSLYSLVHEDDAKLVEKHLCPQDSSRRSFYCRLLEKCSSRNDPSRYEIIHVVGQLKPLAETSSRPQTRTASRRRTTSSDCSHMEISDDECEDGCEVLPSRTGTHMLVSFVQVVRDKPITELTWVESMRDEYITRHRMDGNISYVDHRISIVMGMMPEEVMGNSAFNYMHQDDVLWSIMAQKQMLQSSHGQGMVTYRLITKDGSYVSLRSRGFLEVNKDTGKVDTFVCINTVLKDSDAEKDKREQRTSLLPLLNASPDEIAESFNKDLPPNLQSLVQCFFTSQTLQHMKDTLEEPSQKRPEKHAKIKELPDDASTSWIPTTRSKDHRSPKSPYNKKTHRERKGSRPFEDAIPQPQETPMTSPVYSPQGSPFSTCYSEGNPLSSVSPQSPLAMDEGLVPLQHCYQPPMQLMMDSHSTSYQEFPSCLSNLSPQDFPLDSPTAPNFLSSSICQAGQSHDRTS